MLVSYPDQEVAAELLEGFSNGFRLKYTDPRILSIFASSVDLPQLYIISKILSREE
jgi:hypothetical protein